MNNSVQEQHMEKQKESSVRQELSVGEMKKFAGGNVNSLPDLSGHCPESPNGGDHKWEETAVFTEYLFIKHHVEKCGYCGKCRDNVMPW